MLSMFTGGSQSESWLTVYRDGRIALHTENDRHAFLRYGPEARDTLIDLRGVAELKARHAKPLVEKVKAALAELAGK